MASDILNNAVMYDPDSRKVPPEMLNIVAILIDIATIQVTRWASIDLADALAPLLHLVLYNVWIPQLWRDKFRRERFLRSVPRTW